MKIAVTGGSGQLGSLVLRRLLDDRKVKEVVSLDRRPPLIASGKLRMVTADVRDPGIAEHFQGCDAVIHLAFMIVQHAPREVFFGVNVEGSQNVFTAAAKAGAKQIIYLSSIAAYGVVPGHPNPMREETPRVYQPSFPYPATKYLVEEFLDRFEPEHPDIAVVRFRPGLLVGTRIEHPFGTAHRRRLMPDGGPTPLPVVWDEDVADAVMSALAKKARGAFNVVADEPLPPALMARETGLKLISPNPLIMQGAARASWILEKLGVGMAVDPSWLEDHGAVLIANSDKAKRELDWKPRCPRAVDVFRHYMEVAPGPSPDRRVTVFLRMTDLFSRLATPQLSGYDSRIHLNLTGPRGGDFTIFVRGKENALRIQAGAPRPPTATLTLSAELLLDLIAGRADIMSAQLTGKFRADGEGHAHLILAGMITAFRAAASAKGARGAPVRALARWFAS